MCNVTSHSTLKLPQETGLFLFDLYGPVQSGLCASVFLKDSGAFRKQEFGNPFRIRDVVADALNQYGNSPVDIYLTPNLSRTTRRGNQFTELLTSCYVDLDFYKVGAWSGKSPRTVLKAVKAHLTRIGYPHPSMTVSSGRGLQLYWLLEKPIPMKAFPRWNRLEKTLIKKLSSFGSDDAASDPARVLRLPGSKTSRGGECHVLERVTSKNGLLRRFNFEELAYSIFPCTRRSSHYGQIVSNVEEWVEMHKKDQPRKWFFKSTTFGRQRFYSQIYDDLRAYIEAGKVKEGHRKLAVFHALVAACHARKIRPDQVEDTAKKLALQIDPSWGARAFSNGDFQEVAKRYEEDLQTTAGNSPLYTPSVKKILADVGISKADQGLCNRLCDQKTRKEHKNRDRRVHPDRPMTVIQSERAKRKAQAKDLRLKGWTLERIAECLGITKGTVSKYLNDSFVAKTAPKKPRAPIAEEAAISVCKEHQEPSEKVSNPSMLCLAKPAPSEAQGQSLLTQSSGLPAGRTSVRTTVPRFSSASRLVDAFLASKKPEVALSASLSDDGGGAVAPLSVPIQPPRSDRSSRIVEELMRFCASSEGDSHG